MQTSRKQPFWNWRADSHFRKLLNLRCRCVGIGQVLALHQWQSSVDHQRRSPGAFVVFQRRWHSFCHHWCGSGCSHLRLGFQATNRSLRAQVSSGVNSSLKWAVKLWTVKVSLVDWGAVRLESGNFTKIVTMVKEFSKSWSSYQEYYQLPWLRRFSKKLVLLPRMLPITMVKYIFWKWSFYQDCYRMIFSELQWVERNHERSQDAGVRLSVPSHRNQQLRHRRMGRHASVLVSLTLRETTT